MNPELESAFQTLEKLRLGAQLSGADHDALRLASQSVHHALLRLPGLESQIVDLTAQLAAASKKT